MHKSVRSRALSGGLAVALCVAMVFGGVVPAFATLESPGAYESATNPTIGQEDNATSRWSWGNTFLPHLKVTGVPNDEPDGDLAETNGFIYEVYQVAPTGLVFQAPEWGVSLLSPESKGTIIDMRFDLLAAIARHGYTSYTGASKPGEGLYVLSNRFYNQFRVEDTATADNLPFGVDLTPPSPVQDLTSSAGILPSANGWTESTWRNLRWTPLAYDSLSGVRGFSVSVDASEVAFAQNVAPDPAFEPYADVLNPGWTPIAQLRNVTVENLPAGSSKLSVIVEDRATNESVARSVMAYVDPDTPKLSVTFPADGALVGAKPTFTVKASDAAGISRVKYYVDGNLVGTSSAAPWSLTANLGGFSSGTHTLKIEAEDKIGSAPGTWWVPHVATETRSFRIDKTTPVLTLTSAGPSPFYPRKREGYKDNFVVRFKSNESAKATLTLKDSSGKVWRTITKSVPVGASSISWNGRSNANTMKSGTFKWYLQLSDAAGNKSATKSGSVSLKYYEIVYVGGGARVIER